MLFLNLAQNGQKRNQNISTKSPIPQGTGPQAGRFPVRQTKKSAQPHTPNTPESLTQPTHSHPPQRRTTAWPEGRGVGRGNGLRNSECFPSPRISAFQKAEPFSQKIKLYTKKRPSNAKNVQQSPKRKNLFFTSYLFLTFSSISSALSTSVFSSFGRTMFRIIANTAAGTIPEPPKIRLMACGRCTRIAVLEPSP